MDFFGIGQALKAVLLAFFAGSRRSGRSTRLVASLKPGDRVIVRNASEKRIYEDRLKELEIEGVAIQVVEPGNFHGIFKTAPSVGRTILDHSWIEEFYILEFERIEQQLAAAERQTSGYSEAHRATLRHAIHIKKRGK